MYDILLYGKSISRRSSMNKRILYVFLASLLVLLSACDVPAVSEDTYLYHTEAESVFQTEDTIQAIDTKAETDAHDTDGGTSFTTDITADEPVEISEIPVLRISTEQGKGITSKSEYVRAVMSVEADSDTGFNEEFDGVSLSIKGRGNASWNQFPKKGYRIKLDEGMRLLGMKKDKDWVLVSSYGDKTLLRNVVAHEMAKELSHLEFTPTHVLVELYINDEYLGVYTLAEKIEFGGGKLEYTADGSLDDTPFLLEVGWDYNDEMVYGKSFFDIEYIERIVFKEPEFSEKYTDCARSIIKFMEQAEKAVTELDGYEECIDVDSLIDYLIITELTNNTESVFYRSVYMYRGNDGLLKFGPVWDFDMAFGNHAEDIPDYDGWCSIDNDFDYLGHNGTSWYDFLLKDDEFIEKFKNRWDEVGKTLLDTAFDTIDKQYLAVYNAQVRNFERWDIMDKKVGVGNVDHHTYNTFELQVEYLRNFIMERYEWINTHISEL